MWSADIPPVSTPLFDQYFRSALASRRSPSTNGGGLEPMSRLGMQVKFVCPCKDADEHNVFSIRINKSFRQH